MLYADKRNNRIFRQEHDALPKLVLILSNTFYCGIGCINVRGNIFYCYKFAKMFPKKTNILSINAIIYN